MGDLLVKKAEESKEVYSAQSYLLLKALDDKTFDLDKFEEFIRREMFIIGGAHFNQYLHYKRNEDAKIIAKNKKRIESQIQSKKFSDGV